MDKILLTGLADQETAAVEIMLGMVWHDVQCITLERSRWSNLPHQNAEAKACHHCVIDLSGLDLEEYSSKQAASLLKFLDGRSAVLLVSGDGGGWPEAELPLAPAQRVAWVRKPYRSAELREAVTYIKAAAASVPAAAEKSAFPAPTGSQGRDEMVDVTQGAFDMLLQVMPRLRQVQFMHVIGDLIKQPGAHLVKLGPATFLADAQAGWVVTRFPLASLAKVLEQPQWVNLMKVQPVPSEQVEETINHGLPGPNDCTTRGALELFVWEMASTAAKRAPLEVREDLYFKVQRFPNFTKLEQVGSQDVRLAAICTRIPRSVQELLRVFPQHEQDVLRFVVVCVISGAGVVSWNQPGADGASMPAQATTKKRRGFLKLLLDRIS